MHKFTLIERSYYQSFLYVVVAFSKAPELSIDTKTYYQEHNLYARPTSSGLGVYPSGNFMFFFIMLDWHCLRNIIKYHPR